MRSRAITVTLITAIVSILVLGLPLGIIASNMVANKNDSYNYDNAVNLTSQVDSLMSRQLPVTEEVFNKVQHEAKRKFTFAQILLPGGKVLRYGEDNSRLTYFSESVASTNGALITVKTLDYDSNSEIFLVWVLVVLGGVIVVVVGLVITLRFSDVLSSHMTYLAAQSEQISSGGVSLIPNKTGIEEIDLVQEELSRTSEKFARRLAVERQFASNASHQLRTPLTALLMRIEEIEMISENPEVKREAQYCIEQIDRLTNVVQDLLKSSRNMQNTNQEAVYLFEIFDQQHKEWDMAFRKEKRDLIVIDETKTAVLATPGYISQVIATLIENSLKYGAGTTTVTAFMSGEKGIVIEVTDEGQGISEDIAPYIFDKHFSGHNSTGLGLSIAKDLVKADFGKIELKQNIPPVFRITLTAISAKNIAGAKTENSLIVSVGRRQRNF